MTAEILDGRAVAAALQDRLSGRCAEIRAGGHIPGLAVVLVGHDQASHLYAQRLVRRCAAVGVDAHVHTLPPDVPTEVVLGLIQDLNDRPDVHGILPMLPLPAQVDAAAVALAIAPDKDVECLNPYNFGRLARGESVWAPGTARAVMTILTHYCIPLAGRHAVVVGRSNVVGKPLALLLLQADATVTVCHSRTADLAAITRQADVLVAAVGRPGLVTAAMVKPGAVVIDVGINATAQGITGDVAFSDVAAVAGAITPVPGGVGPVSGLMVMEAVLRRWPA